MTTTTDFLHAILADPADDRPRLIYADWLEEQGDVRAEFIRVQCSPCSVMTSLRGDGRPDFSRCGCCSQCRRERELLTRHYREWGPVGWDWHLLHDMTLGFPMEPHQTAGATFRRGFVSALTLSAADWLTHADALAWHPGQTVECERCGGTGSMSENLWCHHCNRKGRLPRPMPPTACPLEEVTLTTALDWFSPTISGDLVLVADGTNVQYRCQRARYGDHWGLTGPVETWIIKTEWPWITFHLPT